ncbi:uncharacterized protein LOC142767846 [Rhipicephalus microplus]|uniref:uncharacterized protein LOC142767846 n=1 Tax=Rhipicephalus microplus TaxID=6941 RepID=UPI003F6C404A
MGSCQESQDALAAGPTNINQFTRANVDGVKTLGDVSLPDGIRKVLNKGPKFAIQPVKTAPELLTLVRQVSELAPEADADRCVSEGVDVLVKCVGQVIRFLDLKLKFETDHICWEYEPRASKLLLPFDSCHSKLVKRSIATTCFTNALKKSCRHLISESFSKQLERLKAAAYPSHLLISVAESILKKLKHTQGRLSLSECNRNKKCTVVPYMHGIAHNLKKIGKHANVRVLFSAPIKLLSICAQVNKPARVPQLCAVNHKFSYILCAENVVYSIPLSCGRIYVGQTGRCVNTRLKEHEYNVKNTISGHLGIHCRDCGCTPQFRDTKILARHKERKTREIMEAAEIARLKDQCVSRASVTLSQKEMDFLSVG